MNIKKILCLTAFSVSLYSLGMNPTRKLGSLGLRAKLTSRLAKKAAAGVGIASTLAIATDYIQKESANLDQTVFVFPDKSANLKSYTIANGTLTENPITQSYSAYLKNMILRSDSFRVDLEDHHDPVGILVQHDEVANMYTIDTTGCTPLASGIAFHSFDGLKIGAKRLSAEIPESEDAFIDLFDEKAFPSTYYCCLDSKKPQLSTMQLKNKDRYLAAFYNFLYSEEETRWARKRTRDYVQKTLMAADMQDTCGVYRTESNSYSAQCPAFSLKTNQESAHDITITIYVPLIAIDTSESKEDQQCSIYHELGHLKYNDSMIMVLNRDILTSHEIEYRADQFAYTHLTKTGNLVLIAARIIDMTKRALSDKRKYPYSYKDDRYESSHPACWQRAKQCLEHLDKHLKENKSNMGAFIHSLPPDYKLPFATCVSREFPEYLDQKEYAAVGASLMIQGATERNKRCE